ncbi:hypothetical protein RO3G_15710 [Lichtheimia corymbifera JMRC:FSU:9682]|uniref:CCHC-type domain-containing protein n=1 Tax=Lichtheimia corymbifera JMRC:FSU:9682 TaxID=1263082 RepID=A0A068SDE6_9FUNG|nr:hypothetical protein RO3G_15710 [Lichtheimia corymbifera JMRC:FSU:9682]
MSFAQTNKSPDKESGTQTSPQKPSYATATRAPSSIRESLKTPKDQKYATHSNVWKLGGSPASCPSLFFDFTCRPESRSTLLRSVNTTIPNNCGVRLHNDHSRRIVEIFIPEKHDYLMTRAKGIVFPDGQRIVPTKPLSNDARLVHLRLTDLPFTTKDKLSKGMQTALSAYGNVLDFGIFRDYDSSLFMGRGYATLELTAQSGFDQLSHTVPWPDSDDSFHATWAEMPLHCLHCHSPGHATSSCPQHPARSRVCWSCGQKGHRAAKCFNRRSMPATSTQPIKSPSTQSVTSQSSDVSMLNLDPSPIESHNDNIISDFIPDDFNDNTPAPQPQPQTSLHKHIIHMYPMSDHAKNIIASLSPSILEHLSATLQQQGKLLVSSTPASSRSLGSSSSMRGHDPA